MVSKSGNVMGQNLEYASVIFLRVLQECLQTTFRDSIAHALHHIPL